MYYVYVLRSINGKLYTGSTGNLKSRIEEHNKGFVPSTKNMTPFELVYYGVCQSKYDA